MDHNTTTNPETDSVWLTDSEGNNYLVPRDVIAHLIVPSAISAQVKDFVEADTHGYGNGMWAMIGVKDHWGQTSKDKGFDSNFDFDGDGSIGDGDWKIAYNAWLEEGGGKGTITT